MTALGYIINIVLTTLMLLAVAVCVLGKMAVRLMIVVGVATSLLRFLVDAAVGDYGWVMGWDAVAVTAWSATFLIYRWAAQRRAANVPRETKDG